MDAKISSPSVYCCVFSASNSIPDEPVAGIHTNEKVFECPLLQQQASRVTATIRLSKSALHSTDTTPKSTEILFP
jgi:hypothetical protein